MEEENDQRRFRERNVDSLQAAVVERYMSTIRRANFTVFITTTSTVYSRGLEIHTITVMSRSTQLSQSMLKRFREGFASSHCPRRPQSRGGAVLYIPFVCVSV